jgi:hypothetical protein
MVWPYGTLSNIHEKRQFVLINNQGLTPLFLLLDSLFIDTPSSPDKIFVP